MTTPNMGLIIPDPLVTPGPTYASEVNTAFDTIDSHSHAPGEGVAIPTTGLNINADVPFNNFRAYNVAATTYQSDSVSPTLTTSVYVLNGELAYKDGNGTEVVITNNGSIAGASGTISGLVAPATASFSSITNTFVFSNDVAQGGKIAGSDYIMYKFGDTSGNALTHKWSPGSPVSYTIQYPDAAPATNDSVAKTTTAGVQTFNAYGIVPVGGIIAIASNLTGAFPLPTSGTSSRGWQVCDGAAVEAGGTLSGSVPTLDDNRFLQGSSSAGSSGGSNTSSITGTQNIDHRHTMAHTHQWIYRDSNGSMHSSLSSDPSRTSFNGGDTLVNQTFFSDQIAATSFMAVIASDGNFYTTGAIDAATGTGSSAQTGTMTQNPTVNFSNASMNGGNNRPNYLTTIFLIRIK